MYKRQGLALKVDNGARYVTGLRPDWSSIPLLETQVYLNPVSYTHLRAHETVLDLVCRLLLEKKKNKLIITTPSRQKSAYE